MGNSTGSMFYMFIIIIIVYILGMFAFLGFEHLKKKISMRRNQKVLMKKGTK